MKIAFVLENFDKDSGSVSELTKGMVKELSQENKILVITYGEKTIEKRKNIEIRRLKGNSLKIHPMFKFNIIPPYKKVYRFLENFSPDIIHIQTPLSIGAASEYYARKNKVPVVSTFHVDVEGMFGILIKKGKFKTPRLIEKTVFSRKGRDLLSRLMKTLVLPPFYSFYKKMDAVTSPSQAIVNLLVNKKVKKSKVKKIPNFIEINPPHMSKYNFRKKWKISQQDFVVLHVGRLSWEKRIEKIIETANLLPDVKFVITSKGSQKEELENLVKKLKLKNVIFTGYLDYNELYGAYSACDTFITPSPYETFNISAAQSLTFKKPIIGANSMGILDFIHDNENGFLVNLDENEVKNYAKCIQILKHSPELRRKMGRHSKRLASTFSRETVSKQFFEVYKHTKPSGEKWKNAYVFSLFFIFLKMFGI